MKNILMAMAIVASAAVVQAQSRSWTVSGDSLVQVLFANKVKNKNTGSSRDANGQIVELEFGYNGGVFELGPILTYGNTDNGTIVTKTSGFGVYGRYNFKENVAGTGIVPYAQLSILNEEVKVGGVKTDNFSFAIAGGATFFPINDVIGINGFLAYRDQDKKDAGIDYSVKGFELATSFNLYF